LNASANSFFILYCSPEKFLFGGWIPALSWIRCRKVGGAHFSMRTVMVL
jgi:hypothetical protein